MSVIDVIDAIELFYTGVLNEVFNSSASETTIDELVDAIKSVKQTVIDTYSVSK